MKKKDNVVFERKEFLNLPGYNGMANIVAQITANPYKSDGKEYRNTYCTLDFADCSRVISMDINLDNKGSRENALFKVDTLIEVLTEYREAIKEEGKILKKIEKETGNRKKR